MRKATPLRGHDQKHTFHRMNVLCRVRAPSQQVGQVGADACM